MSKRANPTVIGAFVVGAVGLIVLGIVAFGSGRLFRETNHVVMYFSGSMNGLRPGAAINYRGVRIGSVTEIKILLRSDLKALIPVYGEIEPNRIEWADDRQSRKVGKELIDLGLRAQLKSESLVTGQLYVDLDFHPDTPVQLVGADPRVNEIPTIASTIEQISETVKDLRLDELVGTTMNMVRGLDRIVNGPEIGTTLANLNQSFEDLRNTAKLVNSNVGSVVVSAREVMDSFRNTAANLETEVNGALTDYRTLAKTANEEIRPLAKDLREALAVSQDVQRLVQRLDQEAGPLAQEGRETLASARTTIARMDEIFKRIEPHLVAAVDAFEASLADFRKLARTLDENVGPLTETARDMAPVAQKAVAESERALAALRALLADAGPGLTATIEAYRRLAQNADRNLGTLARDGQEAVKAMRAAVQHGEQALADVAKLVAPNAPLQFELARTVRDFGAAARSLQALAESLERNPESLIQGKSSNRR